MSNFCKGIIYYVAVTGDDRTGDGSLERPWATIQRAADAMKPGDTCMIREGFYRETVKPTCSGTADAPIVFKNYENETVTISGTEPVTGWKLDQGCIYKAPMGWTLEDQNQVFVNGEMMTEARWPSNTGTLLQPVLGRVESATSYTITDSTLYGEDDFWKGATLWCGGGSEWIFWTAEVTGYDSATKTLTFAPSREYNSSDSFSHFYAPKKGNPYVLMGIKTALDTEGEWWYDAEKSELLLWAPGGADPSGFEVEAKRRMDVIDLSGCSHVQFMGVHTLAGGVRTDDQTSHCLLKNMKGTYIGHSYLRDVSGSASIHLQGSCNEINSCEFAYSSGSIIKVQGSDNKVINCHIHDGNYAARWNGAFSIDGRRHLISHNTVCDSGRDLVTIHGISESIIEYNDLYHAGWLSSDLGMTYGHNTDGQNTEIRYNKVHDNKARDCSFGIYFDHLSHNFIIHHNVVWNVTDDPIRFNNPSYFNLVFNNTAYHTGKTTTFDHIHRGDLFGMRIMNNIVNKEIRLPDHVVEENNLVSEDPGFVNPEQGDYRLKMDSSARGAGVGVPGIIGGAQGSQYDAGAYVYGQSDWKTGHDFKNPPEVDFKPSQVLYQNHVKNAAFEYGTLESWEKTGAGNACLVPGNTWGNKPPQNTGTSKYELQLGEGQDGVTQVITGLQPNTTYMLSGWMKVSDPSVTVTLGVKDYGDKEEKVFADSVEWTRRSLMFTTGSCNTTAVIYYEKTSEGKGCAFCDNTGLVYVK